MAAFGQPCPRCPTCATVTTLGTSLGTSFGSYSQAFQCAACIQQAPSLDGCWSATTYQWPWTPILAQFKFQNDPAWASSLALLMRSTPFAEAAIEHAEWLIPIPLSSLRLSERGFNQALLLSKHLCASKTQANLLLRMRHTAIQSTLKRKQRLVNLDGAFAVSPLLVPLLRGKRVMLIDDVMTSGATLNVAAKVLKQAGASHVTAMVFARTPA